MAAKNGTKKPKKKREPFLTPTPAPSPLTISITAKVTGGPKDSIFRGEFSGDIEAENLPILSRLFEMLKRDDGKPPAAIAKVAPRFGI